MIEGRYREYKPSLSWLLIFVPVALTIRFWPGGGDQTALFICAAIGIIPLAGWMGRATESLASRMGEGLGGLLNATFGNAAELIIAGYCAFERPDRSGEGIDHWLDYRQHPARSGPLDFMRRHQVQRAALQQTGARTSAIFFPWPPSR